MTNEQIIEDLGDSHNILTGSQFLQVAQLVDVLSGGELLSDKESIIEILKVDKVTLAELVVKELYSITKEQAREVVNQIYIDTL